MTEEAVPHTPELREIALSIPCNDCKAVVGRPCVDPRGVVLNEGGPAHFHLVRVTPIWVIYKIGYRNGRRDTMKEMKSANAGSSDV